ncbi:MAG: rhodanese-like domain-containing protein [Cellulophaga sp.]|uniref:rhodanese-like domain-containing protein n=1 Tax=unclassified Cellulophaga TaxID=2634405 RepID=UPI000C2C6B47|nr:MULTISPECIES: rhodanese-like domain-containing protein [unclassified Cellulophaga]MDO6490504.1 rhodanese-like domain-containing protein [Cellulophaga sp. 2_MG-2023]MDO6494302.1 rhodanese-like domain-containing protein [Cellulophaga sp. 3_MG-2023]PKB41855.1 rhodanese-related sulfurtransferase [Cellulophaga sp. RHA19]
MKSFFSVLFFALVITACSQSKSKHITEFSQNDIKNALLVDVRTSEEYGLGHLENSKNVNVLNDSFVSYFDSIPKTKTIYVYCKSGGRSAKAAAKLTELGYNAINLEGGYDAVKEKNTAKK